METKANYVRVGLFTMLVIALSFGFVYWAIFATSGSERVRLLVRIEGSVTGLQQGSQVLFNGLPVGSVKALRLDSNNPEVVIATTEVDPDLPIKASTQANIGFQGLTAPPGNSHPIPDSGNVSKARDVDQATVHGRHMAQRKGGRQPIDPSRQFLHFRHLLLSVLTLRTVSKGIGVKP